MANTNAFSRRIEAGSIITLQDLTAVGTIYTLIAAERGVVEWTEGGYEPIEYLDRGVMQDPLEGDERPTEVTLKVKYTGSADVADVAKILAARDTNAKMNLFRLIVKIPDKKGAATGQSLTFAKCFVKAGGVKITGGKEYDVLDANLTDNEVRPTAATY